MPTYEPSSSPTASSSSGASDDLDSVQPHQPPVPPNAYYNQTSQEQNLEADLYNKFAAEASAAAASKAGGPTWAQRRIPSSILAAAATLLTLLDALCCTSPDLGGIIYAYSWSVGSGSKSMTVRIGVFARVVDGEIEAMMAGDWGGPSSASYLQTWFFCQLFLLIMVVLAWCGVAFAPHPPEDVVLRRYRHLIRACIMLLIALTGVPWSLLATLAASQDDSQIGYFAVVGQGVIVGGSCFGLFLALRLERDEDWLTGHEDFLDQQRSAKLRDRQRRAEFKQRKAAAMALARQRKAHRKVMAEALGREGARALLINQMMSSKQQDKDKSFGGSAAGVFGAFSGQSATPWSYPPQPPPPAYQMPGYGGGGYGFGGYY